MSEQLTLYTAKICPFAHRVELALAEAKAGYTRCEIDLSNKPEWYAPKVNPASKVPAIAYGGPQTSPELPAPESVKIAESLILVEFIADLYPDSNILPKDPVQRARARFFIDVVSTKVLPAYMGPVARGQSFEPFWEALDALQKLLTLGKTYAVSDEYTAADIAITPFLARMEVWMKNDIGAYKAGEGIKAAAEFFEGERFKRLREYYEAIKGRESFKATFDENYIKEKYALRFAPMRQQVQAAAAAKA
ncbi:glutathione S-transferase [Roridomyces roridus]|uniref:Glutathione S-transferase n=1 Tax=Roridomyces roridus TaxID=1738132 RepID=A0AAD7C1M5_9AGAR|nr:glutathione S-transferase [Roridomyces roridus]